MRVLAGIRFKNGDRKVWTFNPPDTNIGDIARRLLDEGFTDHTDRFMPPERLQTVLVMQVDALRAA